MTAGRSRHDAVVRNYAETAFELAEREARQGGHEGPETFGEALAAVARLWEDPVVRRFFATPRVPAAAKKKALDAVGADLPVMLARFLKIMIDKRRQDRVPAVAARYAVLLDRWMGRRHMDVTLARPLDEAASQEVEAGLSRAVGADVTARFLVDPSILGGVVIREGDTIRDGSVKRRLDGMRRALVHGPDFNA